MSTLVTEALREKLAREEKQKRRSGITLSARLLENGKVITCLSGLSFAHPSPSKPQYIKGLEMQLDNSPLRPGQKEEFFKTLREKGTAEILLPTHLSTLFAV